MSPTVTFDLAAYLETERLAIEAARTRVTAELLATAPDTLVDPIRYALEAGGKRLRPVLCVAAYRAAGGEPKAEGIYTVATAIELIHTYSLVHDDLPCMDDDDLRRGKPTTHRVFGERHAIVAGAAMISLAAQALDDGGLALGLAETERMALVQALSRAAGAGGMVGGQWMDLKAEGQAVTIDTLESIHRRKTGALLAASTQIGGLAAKAESRVTDALAEYGAAIGLAFQIADDVLDVTASTTELGKTAGRDSEMAKVTYPSLLGLENARARAHREAEHAVRVLHAAGIESPALEALARYTVERDR